MLDGCARKQMTSLAGHILSDMESSGIAPSSQTLRTQMFSGAEDGRRRKHLYAKVFVTLRLHELDGREKLG